MANQLSKCVNKVAWVQNSAWHRPYFLSKLYCKFQAFSKGFLEYEKHPSFKKLHCCVLTSQLPGGHISPSQISKKFLQQSCGQIPLVFGISKWQRWKNWGATVALRELQCTLGAEPKKSIALLFGLQSKNVIKWNILCTPTFVPNFKVSDRFAQR